MYEDLRVASAGNECEEVGITTDEVIAVYCLVGRMDLRIRDGAS